MSFCRYVSNNESLDHVPPGTESIAEETRLNFDHTNEFYHHNSLDINLKATINRVEITSSFIANDGRILLSDKVL